VQFGDHDGRYSGADPISKRRAHTARVRQCTSTRTLRTLRAAARAIPMDRAPLHRMG
jgi:hypothetical protein